MKTVTDYGFDSGYISGIDSEKYAGFEPARIIAVNRDNYLVRTRYGECLAELTGRLIYLSETSLDRPTVGDWVLIQLFNEATFGVIHEVLQRRSVLRRKAAGQKAEFQLIAANIDIAFIVQAEDFNLNRLERYLVMVREGGIKAVLLLNKSDLFGPVETEKRIAAVRALQSSLPVLSISSISGEGLPEVLAMIGPGQTCCLLGSSGVGKTTILNKLAGEEIRPVNEVREKDSRGRHTTTRRELFMLQNGGLIIDTPGMRELGLFDIHSGMEMTFEDIQARSRECRFADCTHSHEKGCAVREALERGEIDESHYTNYLKMMKENEYLERSYLEKRKRDRQFGRMQKRVMKNNRKK